MDLDGVDEAACAVPGFARMNTQARIAAAWPGSARTPLATQSVPQPHCTNAPCGSVAQYAPLAIAPLASACQPVRSTARSERQNLPNLPHVAHRGAVQLRHFRPHACHAICAVETSLTPQGCIKVIASLAAQPSVVVASRVCLDPHSSKPPSPLTHARKDMCAACAQLSAQAGTAARSSESDDAATSALCVGAAGRPSKDCMSCRR